MESEDRERLYAICQQIQKESDPKKFEALLRELETLLRRCLDDPLWKP